MKATELDTYTFLQKATKILEVLFLVLHVDRDERFALRIACPKQYLAKKYKLDSGKIRTRLETVQWRERGRGGETHKKLYKLERNGRNN
jgi:hypothetical protein